MNQNDLDDYAPHLMELEIIIKRLHDKCLHKKYDGYMQDIGYAHDRLSKLLLWMMREVHKK